jgi:hypothetical protein
VKVLADHEPLPIAVPPEAVLLVMTGVSQVMAIEQSLGITSGHESTLDFMDQLIELMENTPMQSHR